MDKKEKLLGRKQMQAWIVAMMERFGYAGVAGLIALENIFPPIPSEVILTFGGFLTVYAGLNVWLVILSATAGSMIGAVFLYGVGRSMNQVRLEAVLAGKIGKTLRLDPKDVRKAALWFQTKGKAAVFFCRFVPIIRSLISIPAGFAHMEAIPFLLLTAAGSLLWNTILIWLGVGAGASWSRVVRYLDSVGGAVRFLLLAGAVVFLLLLLRRRKLSK